MTHANAVVPLFPDNIQSAQSVGIPKVQASAMITNTILMTYLIIGPYIQVHETCNEGCEDSTYY